MTSRIQESNEKWTHLSKPKVSVVVIGFQNALWLARSVRSLMAHCSANDWELILVLNAPTPEVSDWANAWLATNRWPTSVIQCEPMRPGAARNVGVALARADLLFFLDDDAECFQDLVAHGLELFQKYPRLAAAGGANITPPSSNALARATGYAFETFFGAATMRARYVVMPEGPADEHSLILCNLLMKKNWFLRYSGFATQLVSNEENLLLQKMDADGALLWHSPKLSVWHKRRDTWARLWGQVVKYGTGRAQNMVVLPQSAAWFYFLPSVVLAYFVSVPIGLWFFGGLYVVPFCLYGGFSLIFTVQSLVKYRDFAACLMPLVFITMHMGYGFGFASVFRWYLRRQSLVRHA